MLKALILNGRIETTIVKAKELRRHADKMITMAKKDSLASRRNAIAALMVSFNPLTPKEARAVREQNDTSSYNGDRLVINKLYELKERFVTREGGYTRIMRLPTRVGDNAQMCIIEYLSA
jgi:large subunit ribosomal protein L17